MEKVAAVIVVYNGMRRNWIKKCLNSLLNSSIPIDIIAIDNGSTDESITYIEQHYPQIDFTVLNENMGFGKANNIGMKKALDKGADFVFLLNQDAWVDIDTIQQLAEQQQLHPEYGILSPIHCNGNGDALDYRFSEYISPQKGCKLLSDLLVVDRQTSRIYDVSFVNAAAWLISKECLRKVGGFSPMFYHYGEDVNYCHRVIYHGMKIGVYPNAKIWHDRQESNSNDYFAKDIAKMRVLLTKMLNPNRPLSQKEAITAMNYEIGKHLFKRNIKACRNFFSNKRKIVSQKNTIAIHLEELKAGRQYMFLAD